MDDHWRKWAFAAIVMLVALPGLPSERAFLDIWERHLDAPDAHVQVADEARLLLASRTLETEWSAAVQTLLAWRLLQAGRTEAAAERFEAVLTRRSDRPVGRAAETMARRWLTRMDREIVRAALRAHFARHVAFPERLDALSFPEDMPPPPLTDRFGTPWDYRLETYTRLSGLPAHRYRLQSRTLGAQTDLDIARNIPYPRADHIRVLRQVSSQPVAIAFEIDRQGETDTVTLAEGGRFGSIRFVRRGADVALLTEQDDFWMVVRPERRDGYGALP